VLERRFENYLKVVSDVSFEDTIVDNKDDNNDVDKKILVEENSTRGAILQGGKGVVTAHGVEEEFNDPYYNLSDGDDDFRDVIDDQQVKKEAQMQGLYDSSSPHIERRFIFTATHQAAPAGN
ncbi:hypothetical protein HAX54_025068, partial [Datura stramonium]|nr:hypothetical protein [Datura stramonium]